MEEIKNNETVTGGIFYCRDSVDFRVSTSNKLSCNLTGQCFEIGNKNIPPKRWRSLEKTQQQHEALTKKDKFKLVLTIRL